jgi:hypothetical protein
MRGNDREMAFSETWKAKGQKRADAPEGAPAPEEGSEKPDG